MADRQTTPGLVAAASSFIGWGLLPIYWKALMAVPAVEIICHRVVWSLVFTGGLLALLGGFGAVRAALGSRRSALLLLASSSLIGVNWFLYIWSVVNSHVLEASLGYYLNPLVNVVLGMAVFRDRLSRTQAIAVGLAAAGVAVQVVLAGSLPWIALTLAVTFGLYGLTRKVMDVEALPGLFVETLILSVPAGAYLAWLWAQGGGAFGRMGAGTDLLLAGGGVVTALPLLAFAFGARRITLTTLGVLQYLSPTGIFLLGALVYGEKFGLAQAATFGLIWAGVALYTVDGARKVRWMKDKEDGSISR